jgi:transcriptional antiterminator NusG
MTENQDNTQETSQEPQATKDTSNMRWYVIQAFSGYEKKVKESLQEHIDRNEMQEFFGDILVPTEEVVEMKAGQKRTSERKFFPGYVLVHMAMTDETWHLVKGVPRIAGFIGGTENRPMPISDREADEIIQQVTDSADAPKMKFTFAPGELVRIIDGPFADFNGTVEDANFEKSKLRVSVTIFGRSTPVELDFTQVEKG